MSDLISVQMYFDDADRQEFVEDLLWRGGVSKVGDLGEAKLVASKNGVEGGGEDIWVVFQIDNSLYRISGFYSSYDGSDWNESDITEVTPVQKMVTFYEPVK